MYVGKFEVVPGVTGMKFESMGGWPGTVSAVHGSANVDCVAVWFFVAL